MSKLNIPPSPRGPSAKKAIEENYMFISKEDIASLFDKLKKQGSLNSNDAFSVNSDFGFEATDVAKGEIKFNSEASTLTFTGGLPIVNGATNQFGFRPETIFDVSNGFVKDNSRDDEEAKKCRSGAWRLMREAFKEVGTSIEKVAKPVKEEFGFTRT